MSSSILVIILYLSNVRVIKNMFVQQIPLATLKYKIIIGYERVLQNFVPRLMHSLHQLQDLLTEIILYMSNVSYAKITFAQHVP